MSATPSQIAAGQQMSAMLAGSADPVATATEAAEAAANPESGMTDTTKAMMEIAGVKEAEAAPAPESSAVEANQEQEENEVATPDPGLEAKEIQKDPEPATPEAIESEEKNDEPESSLNPDMEALLDELIEETKSETEERLKEDDKQKGVDKTDKEDIISEEVIEENRSLKNKNRTLEEDKTWFENQSSHRKSKAEEATLELEDAKFKLKTGANIPSALNGFAKDFQSWEDAENPTVLDKKNLLTHIGKIYKNITGQNIDHVINSHLQGSSVNTSSAGSSLMDVDMSRRAGSANDSVTQITF